MKNITRLTIFSVLIMLFTVILALEVHRNPPENKNKDDEPINLNFDDVDISEVATFISKITKRNIILDSNVKGKITLIIPEEVSIDEAWEIFIESLDALGFIAEDVGTHTVIYPKNKKTR